MTFYDFLIANPWATYAIVAVVIVGLVGITAFLLRAYREGRPISIFGIKVGPRPRAPRSRLDEVYDTTLQRSRRFLKGSIVDRYTQEVARIRAGLPDQAITSLALRSTIHQQLLDMALQRHGGFAGMGYPGRRLYLEFTTERLVEMLPEYVDAENQAQLDQKIADFFRITEPNMYGVAIPDDDYQVALQVGIYIIRRLTKVQKWVQKRMEQGQAADAYTEEALHPPE